MQYCMQLWKGCPYRPCQPIDRVLEAFRLWWDSCRGLVFVSCRGACLYKRSASDTLVQYALRTP